MDQGIYGEMRKSNERAKNSQIARGKMQFSKSDLDKVVVNDDVISLQGQSHTNARPVGDGICTVVNDGEVTNDEEELDYEDDLSMDQDGLEIISPDDKNLEFEEITNQASQTNHTSIEPRPGTSGETGRRNSHNQTNANALMELLNKQPEEALMNNPILQRMMMKFFEEKFKDVKATPAHQTGLQIEGKTNKNQGGKTIKSPSDTTIYAPALQRKLTPQQGFNQKQGAYVVGMMDSNMSNIDAFVEAVRNEQHLQDVAARNLLEMEEAQLKADKAIIEAEKFRASVETPGKDSNHVLNGFRDPLTNMRSVNNDPRNAINLHSKENLGGNVQETSDAFNLLNIGTGVSYDDVFHLTCHIVPGLIHKIEKGEFVELEKLIPKEKLGGKVMKVVSNGFREMEVLFWYLHKEIIKSVVFGNRSRHLGPMLLFIVGQIHIG